MNGAQLDQQKTGAWPPARMRRFRDRLWRASGPTSHVTGMNVSASSSTAIAATLPRRIGIAGIQMHVTAGADNIASMARLAAHAKNRFPWVDAVVFPELAVFGPDPRRAQALPGEAEVRLA